MWRESIYKNWQDSGEGCICDLGRHTDPISQLVDALLAQQCLKSLCVYRWLVPVLTQDWTICASP